MFIVQGKPGEPAGKIKVVQESREAALATANDLLDQGIPFVVIEADDGSIYTAEEFALMIINE